MCFPGCGELLVGNVFVPYGQFFSSVLREQPTPRNQNYREQRAVAEVEGREYQTTMMQKAVPVQETKAPLNLFTLETDG